jgi:ribosome-associated toxin RatA of RatAB toxin-antitoxin module
MMMMKLKYTLTTLSVWIALVVFFMPVGCSSRYTVPPSDKQPYPGEINRHVRWIQAEPDHIYRILTHPEGIKIVCPEGTIVSYLSPQPYSVGDIVETRVEHIFKLKWTARVEQVIENRLIRLTFQDGFFKGGTELWQFSPQANGTRVSQAIIVEPKGFLKRLAWVTKIRRKHDKMVELFLDNLKREAEMQPSRLDGILKSDNSN